MAQLIYDGSFAGLLTAVFEAYEKKWFTARLVAGERLESLEMEDNITVITDQAKARRVWAGLKKKLSDESMKMIYWCFLSEIKGIENTLLEFIRYVLSASENVETDFGNNYVLLVRQTARKVAREKHRFEAFVRFELIGSNLYYAPVDPDFNVLPLILPHFRRRYPDMSWIIYDTKRKYGVHYDHLTEQSAEVSIDFAGSHQLMPGDLTFDPDEQKYQDLWRNYFKSVNIPVRKNTRLHLRHIPKRYWKYLSEKK